MNSNKLLEPVSMYVLHPFSINNLPPDVKSQIDTLSEDLTSTTLRVLNK